MRALQFRPCVEALERRLALSAYFGASAEIETSERMTTEAEMIEPVDDHESSRFSVCIDSAEGCRVLKVQFAELREPRLLTVIGGESTRVGSDGSARLKIPDLVHAVELTISDEHGVQVPFLRIDVSDPCSFECEEFDVGVASSRRIAASGLSMLIAHGHTFLSSRDDDSSMTNDHDRETLTPFAARHSLDMRAMSMTGMLPMSIAMPEMRPELNTTDHPENSAVPPAESIPENEDEFHPNFEARSPDMSADISFEGVDAVWAESLEYLLMNWTGGPLDDVQPGVTNRSDSLPSVSRPVSAGVVETETIVVPIPIVDECWESQFEIPARTDQIYGFILAGGLSLAGSCLLERRATKFEQFARRQYSKV